MHEDFLPFCRLVSERFGIGDARTDEVASFRARVASWPLAQCSMLDVEATGRLTLFRSSEHVKYARQDFYTVALLQRGSVTVNQHGRDANIGSGQLVLCDSRSPFSLEFHGEFRQRLLNVPCQLLEHFWLTESGRTATSVDASTGLAAISASILLRLGPGSQHDADLALVESHLIEQVSRVFGTNSVRPEQDPPVNRLALRRAQGLIESNLSDPKLTPELLAQRLGCSRRYLYKLFEATEEGIAQFIRRRRIESARRLLDAQPTQLSTSAEVAYAVGFRSAATFSRAFHSVVGVTPTDYRRKSGGD